MLYFRVHSHAIRPGILAALLFSSTGCAALLDSIAKMKQEKNAMRDQVMQQDGYQLVSSSGLNNLSERPFKGHKTKFCTDVIDPLTTDNLATDVKTAKSKLSSFSARLRKDRFYLYVPGTNATLLLSVPIADKEEILENARRSMICGWSDGDVTDFVPNTVDAANYDHLSNGLHEIPLVKWDGITRVEARGGTAPTSGSSPASARCAEPPLQSFDKVMNASFVAEFTTCPVKVKTQFSQLPGMPGMCAFPDTMLLIAGDTKLVAAPKSAVDTVVSLKPGDPITMVGRTRQSAPGMPFWCFVADSIERDAPVSK